MSWDGVRRRATDNGEEDPVLILTRIDERLKNHLSSYEDFKRAYIQHVVDDTANFDKIKEYINKAKGAVLISVAIVGTFSTIIVSWITKH